MIDVQEFGRINRRMYDLISSTKLLLPGSDTEDKKPKELDFETYEKNIATLKGMYKDLEKYAGKDQKKYLEKREDDIAGLERRADEIKKQQSELEKKVKEKQ